MANGSIRIRMYDVGFGDCFLLQIPTSDGLRKVLVDCGSIKQGAKPLGDIVTQLIKDVTDKDHVPRIDVVIATHRHRDHISGFENPAWADVQVGEVWMPWTENDDDPAARAIREQQFRLALRLQNALAFLPADQQESLGALTLNALANEGAMQTLRDGFLPHDKHPPKTQRHYLPDAALSRTLDSKALPGIDVSIMGPARDPDVLKYMEPHANDDHYLRLAGEPDDDGSNGGLFPSDWTAEGPITVSSEERRRIREMGKGNEMALASWLDGVLNNTSLMIMLKIRKAHVLLPGDSQWGTWMRVLADEGWKDVLRRTAVYKVGHHGSYNATPPAFVDQYLGDHALSLVSVIPHGSYKEVPKSDLLTALAGNGRPVVRSDQVAQAPAILDKKLRKGTSVEFAIPTT